MAIKFNKNQWWISSKRNLAKNKGISVHYSAAHTNYCSAWKHTTKEDNEALESEGHPNLSNTKNPPKTRQTTKTQRLKAKNGVEYTCDMVEGRCSDEDEEDGTRNK
jgi:hypothetical protein